jgi:predicted nucleic acid-binding protein
MRGRLIPVRSTSTWLTAFLDQFETSATTIVWIQGPEAARAQAIIRQYADKIFSLTDATSFVLMERHRIGVALTSDRNFAQYGLVTLGGEP